VTQKLKRFAMRKRIAAAILLAAICLVGSDKPLEGQLRWPDPPKREPMRVRLVAAVWADPRSSFFSSHEVFVAETEIGDDEWSLIKLVFTFLPYQPRLLQTGFDYSLVHEFSAWRDTDCDETVAQLTERDLPTPHREPLIYARDVPPVSLDRRHTPLPCYETDADNYTGASHEPVAPPERPNPVLKDRATMR
jgi:hypothetical protein